MAKMEHQPDELLQRLYRLEEVVQLQANENGLLRRELGTLRGRLASLETTAGVVAEEQAVVNLPHGRDHQELAESAETSEASGAIQCCLEAGNWKPEVKTDCQMKKLTTSTIIDTQTHHELQESFWDALLLAGLDEIGPAGTAMIVLGVIVSFSLQLLFCWIIMISFLSPDSKYDLQYLREWRVLYGHSVSFYDKVSGASLVSKICQGKPFEREWWNNALLTIWACHISAELQNVGSFGRSILRLPRGRTVVSSIREDERVFESISRERLIALSFVVLARLAIAIMLGTSGGLWLALTRDVTNIMLNAVALLFVLEIDDLLYKVLAPKHAIKYLASVREFEVGHRKTWAGVDMSCVVKVTALVLTLGCFIRYTVWENAVQAGHARRLLCGGNQDFVYGSHPSLGPVFVADTLPFDQRAANMLPGMRPLVNQVVFNYNVADMDKYMWRKEVDGKLLAVKHLPSAAEMEAWLQMSDTQAPEETAFGSRSYGTYCKDQDDPEWWEAEWIWPTLEALTGATSCAEAKPFCDQKELPLVRMVCPETCGCTDAASGLYSDNGCRQLCQKESRFQRALNRSTCHDFTAAEVHRKEVWQRWWSGFYNHSQGTWDEGNAMMQFASDGASGNCSFLETESWIRDTVCETKPGIHRPASLVCPVTCGCSQDAAGSAWCPTACSA